MFLDDDRPLGIAHRLLGQFGSAIVKLCCGDSVHISSAQRKGKLLNFLSEYCNTKQWSFERSICTNRRVIFAFDGSIQSNDRGNPLSHGNNPFNLHASATRLMAIVYAAVR